MDTSREYYSEVHDIPLLNWEKCLEGKFYFMRKERAKEYDSKDVEAFYMLYDKYIEKYGLSEQHRKYIEAQKRYVDLVCRYVEAEKPDEFLLNYIAIEEAKLKQLDPNNHKGMTIGQTVTILSKWLGQWFDKRTRTLEEFKDLIEEYERSTK